LTIVTKGSHASCSIGSVGQQRVASEVAKWRSPHDVWIDHATLSDSDAEWLHDVRRLTLWAVQQPAGLLGRLPNLELLDIRGGSGPDIDAVGGCAALRVLVVNQVRGMRDLHSIESLEGLEFLSLYGLPQVADLPSAATLTGLVRVELGSMKGLSSIRPLLSAPGLEELQLQRAVRLSDDDVAAIADHPTLRRFGWFAEDIPVRVWQPVVAAVDLPAPEALRPEAWLDQRPT
ncbi:MAG TPA: hypothetical protein VFL10_02305, partial [Ornithinibacter sp.]|nr:hypothetical protein [Ornithinibacter sp.]